MSLESWDLHHPKLGHLTVQFGYDSDFHEVDPQWPGDPKEYMPVEVGDSVKHRLTARIKNPPLRTQISHDGRILRRLADVPTTRVPLAARPKDKLGELESMIAPPPKDKPSVSFQRNIFGEVISVSFRRGNEVIEFDPPAGSRGEAYLKALESSQVKRFFFTSAAGLGKGGWALFVVLFGGFFGRILDWLLSFLPDWDLPDIELPHIALPVPRFPDIALPTPRWPDWNLPDPPGWLVFIMDYTNVWIPILVGVVAGVLAMRNHKKSEDKKKQWQSEPLES